MTETTPSERRYQRTRQQILAAAQAILGEQGVEGLSMRALAEKVDYSPAALYKYFANKEELIAALRQQGQEFSAAIQQRRLQPGMSMAETFQAMYESYLEFARTYPALYELIINPTEDVPQNFAAFQQSEDFRGLIGFASAVVQSGQVRLPEGYQPIHLAFLMAFIAGGAAMMQNTVLRNCQPEFLEVSSKVMEMLTYWILPHPSAPISGEPVQ